MGQENVASKQVDVGDNPVLIALYQFDPNHGNLFDSIFLCFSPPLTTDTKVSLRNKPYTHGAPYFSSSENYNLVYLAFVG